MKDGLVNNGNGSLIFNKYLSEAAATIFVSAPLKTTVFTITKVSPSLTSFFIDQTNGDETTVCSQTPADEKWHNGTSAQPVVGNIIYNDDQGFEVFNGGDALHLCRWCRRFLL